MKNVMHQAAHGFVLFLMLWGLAYPVFASSDALVVGVFPRRNAQETVQAFQPLVDYLGKKLGRPVRLEVAPDFPTFWQGVTTLKYDIVHYNQYHYVRSHKRLGYEVIAMNEEFGRSTISGSVTIRKDSGIRNIEDLRGQKIVFGGGKTAMMSYIVPVYLLKHNGLNSKDYVADFSINPPSAVLAVFYRQAKAAGVGDIVLSLPGIKKKCEVKELQFLLTSKPMAHLPWAVKSDISNGLQNKIQKILIDMSKSPEGRAVLKRAKLTGIIEAQDSDYDQHRKIIADVLDENY